MQEPEAQGAWRELESRLRPFVASRVRTPADVDDVLQDVYVKMQRSLASVREDERFASWLFQIARRVIADHHRDRARHPLAAPDAQAHELEASSDDDGRDAMESELTRCVAGFVAALPSPYREAIQLTELEGLSQKDAAERLGLSHSGMKSRVQRGREQLRSMFDACCAIELDTRKRVMECAPRGCAPDAGDRCGGSGSS